MKIQLFAFVIIVLICFTSGCDDSFSPSAPFEPKMVVYSILTTQSDTQYVRIYSSYNPPNNDPSQNAEEVGVTDAQVTISDGIKTFTFRDTVIQRPSQSRYTSPIHVYYAYPMHVDSNKTYVLNAVSPTYDRVTAKTTVPGAGSLSVLSKDVLDDPSIPGQTYGKSVFLSYLRANPPKPFLIRFYLVYNSENGWIPEPERSQERRYEVPLRRIVIDPRYLVCKIIYQEPYAALPLPRSFGRVQTPETYQFTNYNLSIAGIGFFNFNVQYKRAVFYLVQMDDSWYKYYQSSNISKNPYAVRVNMPTYTNIEGGVGLFSSMRVDSVVHQLPRYIFPFPPGVPVNFTPCPEDQLIQVARNALPPFGARY